MFLELRLHVQSKETEENCAPRRFRSVQKRWRLRQDTEVRLSSDTATFLRKDAAVFRSHG